MVSDPHAGAMRILGNQIEDRNEFLVGRGLWREFQAWLSERGADDEPGREAPEEEDAEEDEEEEC